jgi:hypothetical protein
MQIAGKANDEAMVYRVAYAYEQATCWTHRHPSLSYEAYLVRPFISQRL